MLPPRHMNDGTVDSVDVPLRTITAAAGHVYAVAEPFLVPHYGERPGQPPRTHSVDEPVPTIPPRATASSKSSSRLWSRPAGRRSTPISTEQPLNTVLTRDHMALVEPIIASYYGTQNVSPVDAPLPTVTAKDRFALVQPVVNGRALDIRLRMLKPHELARAMSFGDDYQFAGNQGEKVKQIGNAWPCRLGQALAGYRKLAASKPERRQTSKKRKDRALGHHVSEVRSYVFQREQDTCRCCGWRPATSMHEIVGAGATGSRWKATNKHNSIAVCGDGVRGCHGYLQRYEIVPLQATLASGVPGIAPMLTWVIDAERPIRFEARTPAAMRWMERP
jgi:hypothetical protein